MAPPGIHQRNHGWVNLKFLKLTSKNSLLTPSSKGCQPPLIHFFVTTNLVQHTAQQSTVLGEISEPKNSVLHEALTSQNMWEVFRIYP